MINLMCMNQNIALILEADAAIKSRHYYPTRYTQSNPSQSAPNISSARQTIHKLKAMQAPTLRPTNSNYLSTLAHLPFAAILWQSTFPNAFAYPHTATTANILPSNRAYLCTQHPMLSIPHHSQRAANIFPPQFALCLALRASTR